MTGRAVADDRGAVLVVDDDEMIVGLVEHGLLAAGYRVTTASSGAEALERLAEAIPDVVVSDVNMPDMDGFTLVQRLREDPRLRSLPLLFLTSRAARAAYCLMPSSLTRARGFGKVVLGSLLRPPALQHRAGVVWKLTDLFV